MLDNNSTRFQHVYTSHYDKCIAMYEDSVMYEAMFPLYLLAHVQKRKNKSSQVHIEKSLSLFFPPLVPPDLCTQYSACYENCVTCHAVGPSATCEGTPVFLFLNM